MRYALAILLLMTEAVGATQVSPWLPNDKEIELRCATTYQTYSKVQAASTEFSGDSNDFFLDLSVAGSPFYPITAEAELALAKTENRGYGIGDVKLTGRLLLMNDIVGDLFSLMGGVTFIYAPDATVNDPGTPHHGNIELEGHLSIGKELAEGKVWNHRMWALVGGGYAFENSPWLRYQGQYEYNICDRHQVHLFGKGRYGFGDKDFDPTKPFKGYQKIDYHFVDTGFAYLYLIDYVGSIKGAFSYRAWTRNGPKDACIFTIEFLYPLGL
jgi:hypothetical protein